MDGIMNVRVDEIAANVRDVLPARPVAGGSDAGAVTGRSSSS
jgi:hypothetical protein